MQVTFWGTRGSIATPGPATIAYGGNTSCVEVRCGTDILVFDAGAGITDPNVRSASDLNARGVAPIRDRRRAWRRDGTARAPESDLHLARLLQLRCRHV